MASRDGGTRDAAGTGNGGRAGGNKGGGKGDGKGGRKDRDDGTRAPVGTGGGAHGAQGNQAGRDAEGREVGRPDSRSAVHTNEDGISVQRTKQAQDNLDTAVKEYNDIDVGDIIGGLLGVTDVNPVTDPDYNAAVMDAPNAQLDGIAAAVGTLGSLVTGFPGLGLGVTALRQAGVIPEDVGMINLGQLPGAAPPEGFGTLPDGTTVDSPIDTDDPGGSDDNGGNDDTGGSDIGGGSAVQGTLGIKGRTKRADAVEDTSQTPVEGSETVTPQTGTGVDIVTQTGTSGPGVNIPSASSRRRRGTLGGLGMGGLAL